MASQITSISFNGNSYKNQLFEYYRRWFLEDISAKFSIKKVALISFYLSLLVNLVLAIYSSLIRKPQAIALYILKPWGFVNESQARLLGTHFNH
ncbi:hypothetical protein XM47_12270 [Catenovulum maritimum]|uniref:Uncharacterized protein n=1 Tax=Catenovulum maritimum TaxID=1513271 RepID=A0A0J8GVX1_9ALTE|nr:hypothetical protein XM47_12270 [Catenovulum maritimum]